MLDFLHFIFEGPVHYFGTLFFFAMLAGSLSFFGISVRNRSDD